MNNFKKVLAFLCSATLIAGSSVTAFATGGVDATPAAEDRTGGSGFIVAYSCETVTVPTTVKVSFNPQKWDFVVRGSGSSAVKSVEQIVSLNYGISTAATLDKKIKVSFAAEGTEGDGTNEIEFVDSVTKAQAKTDTNTDGAAPNEYKMYLAVAPSTTAVAKGYKADGSEETFAIDSSSHTSNVTSVLLGDTVMTAATGDAVAFANNAAELSYKLGKAVYELKANTNPNFETEQDDFAAMVQPKTLGDIVGFTFVGAMNPNADWTKVKLNAIAITPTYEVEDVDGTETVHSGEGAGYNVLGEAAAAATPVTGTYNSTSNTYVITLAAAVSGQSDIANFKVGGNTVTYTLNTNKNKVSVNRGDVKTAMGTDWSTATDLEFTFTVDGVNYVSTIAKQ